MTLKTQSNTRVMTIDDGNHRLFFDRVDNEVRVFEHYVNDEDQPKLRTTRIVPFSTLIEILKGEMK
jgi:hypothetical protein